MSKDFPTRRVVAGVIFRDSEGKILIVERTYKTSWTIPGGIVEAMESPYEGAVREIKEELGLDRELGRLLCIDYVDDADDERINFVFDGGMMKDEEAESIRLQASELASFRFGTVEEAQALVSKSAAPRYPWIIKALADGTTLYLENGQPVSGSSSQEPESSSQ